LKGTPVHAHTRQPAAVALPDAAASGFDLGLSKRLPRPWISATLHYDELHGASFLDSPLVERSFDWSSGCSFAWMFGKSSPPVEVPH